MKNPTSPTKSQFITRFHLTKTTTKAHFADGKSIARRTLYIDPHGKLFVFYNNDLHLIRTYKDESYIGGMEKLNCIIGSGYSWYH